MCAWVYVCVVLLCVLGCMCVYVCCMYMCVTKLIRLLKKYVFVVSCRSAVRSGSWRSVADTLPERAVKLYFARLVYRGTTMTVSH